MKKLQLLLTNPCAENWDEMPITANGRYCDNCAKQIVDLTNKTDLEIVQFFKQKKANVCGRLLASQLHRDLIVAKPTTNWHWLLPFTIGITTVTAAQAKDLKPVFFQQDNAFSHLDAITKTSKTGHVLQDTIIGRVIDAQTGLALPGVKIKQEGYENVLAISDNSGNFKITLGKGDSNANLTFNQIGYKQCIAKLKKDMVVKMNVAPIILGGIVKISTTKGPLYVVSAGKKQCMFEGILPKEILPQWIDKLEVLKDASATAIYGSKGANGVVLVNIKKEYVKKVNFSKKN